MDIFFFSLQVPLCRTMDNEGQDYVSAEVSDTLESVSFLNIEGKPSPMESTVLPNTEEQEVWIGFVIHLLIMGVLSFNSGKYLVRTALFPCPQDAFNSFAYFSLFANRS